MGVTIDPTTAFGRKKALQARDCAEAAEFALNAVVEPAMWG